MYVSLPDDPTAVDAGLRVIRTEMHLRGCPPHVFDGALPKLKRLMENATRPTRVAIQPGASPASVTICLNDATLALKPRARVSLC